MKPKPHSLLFFFATISLLAGISMVGCGQATSNGQIQIAGAIAIVDLDKVAAATGRGEQLNQAIKEKEDELNLQLEQERTALESQIATKKIEFGDEPTEQQQAELQALQLDARRKLLVSQQQAKNQLVQERARLIGEFRAEIQPVVRKVAQEKKFALVLSKNDAMMLVYESSIDITEAVAEGLSESEPAPEPAADPAPESE